MDKCFKWHFYFYLFFFLLFLKIDKEWKSEKNPFGRFVCERARGGGGGGGGVMDI